VELYRDNLPFNEAPSMAVNFGTQAPIAIGVCPKGTKIMTKHKISIDYKIINA